MSNGSITLTNAQLEAVEEIDNNLQIIACAGSGKTEVITQRIVNILEKKPNVTSRNIVAFTFTEKAAESMKKRILKKLSNSNSIEEMYVGTIHSFCFQLINNYTDKFDNFKILDTVKNHLFVSRYYYECGLYTLNLTKYPMDVRLFLSCIEKMVDDYDNNVLWDENHRQVFEMYRTCIYDHEYIDFSMLIFETINQIRKNPKVQDYLRTIQYLVVDEYQDIDDLQEKLISLIASFGANICVVGDDDQTIYQFRGSNAENMISFDKRYKNVHQVCLNNNFRCSPEIVDVADCVIQNNENRIQKTMKSGNTNIISEVCAIRSNDKEEQYQKIAEKIQNLHDRGLSYDEIAILVRKGKHINPIANILDNNGIPFTTDSADNFFKSSYFEKFLITLNNLAEIDKSTLYECWHNVIDEKLFNKAFKYLRSCSRGEGFKTLRDILEGFSERLDFLNVECIDLKERTTVLNGILQILDDYDEIYGDWQLSARISGVIDFIDNQALDEYKYHNFEEKDKTEDAVHIMTVHKSKGLEFDTVFLPELEKREFPVANMGGRQYWHVLGGRFEENKDRYRTTLEDERKLFYVAVTRAKRNLYMHYELSKNKLSTFVIEAANSPHLKINQEDLSDNSQKGLTHGKEYWDNVKCARNKLYDYYGTAAQFNKAAYIELSRLKKLTPEEILAEARQHGLI